MENKTKKIIATLLIVSTMCLAAPRPARADFWGASMLSAEWKQVMEQMVKKIEDSLVATLKMAAMRIIQARLSQVMSKMSGGSSSMGISGMLISNWQQFIFSTASQYSMNVTNNFFQTISSGATSSLTTRVITPAKNAVLYGTNSDYYSNITPDLQNYVNEGRADKIFETGWATSPYTAWNMAFAPQNTLWGTYLRGKEVQEKAEAQKAEAQKAEGVAGQGVASTEKNSSSSDGTYTATASSGHLITVPAGSGYKVQNITTPGSVNKDVISKVYGMPIDMVALARTIPEIVAGMVTQVITQTLNNGISNVASKLSGQSTYTSNMNYGSLLNSAGTSAVMSTNSAIQSAIQKGLK
jgi:hypothetical protein